LDGIGPVCWQYHCDSDQTDCGAASCSKDAAECAIAVVNMVLAPIIMVASLATFGLAKVPATAAKFIKIGSKFYKVTKSAKRIRKVYDYSKRLKKLNTVAKVYFKGVKNPTFQKWMNADGEVLFNQLFGEPSLADKTAEDIDAKVKSEGRA
jgi:hypothetical protein